MAESVNALSIKLYPVLEDGTKKKVKEQVQETVGDVIKDIEKSVDTLNEARKENKGTHQKSSVDHPMVSRVRASPGVTSP